MLRHGVRTCETVVPGLPAGWADRLHAQIDSGDLVELLSAAENIATRLGAPGGGEYARWLRKTVGALRVHDHAVIRALAALGVPLATTNYDGLIEDVTGLPPVTWRDGARVERVLRGDEPGVLHLHGHWRDPASVVLGVRSYEAVLGADHAQTIQRALATLRTMVFVGFGAGLGDPNFGALLDWISRVLTGSEYRHYRLCLAREVPALTGTAITPLPYGEDRAELAGFLLGLPAAKADAAPGPAGRLPPRPRCFGRDALVEALVTAVLADPVRPIPVLGPPGIGKSTVSAAALHDPAVVARFGARRWFVRCATTRGGAELHPEILAAMGLSPGADPRAQVLAALAAAPAALVLDNGETPWEADREGTEAALAELAGVPGLALVLTARGRQRPPGVPWCDAVEVPPLKLADARELFLSVAGRRFAADPVLEPLLVAQDGLPLTVELLAYRAEGEPDLAGLWRRWRAKRHSLITSGSLGFRAGPEVSFEVSINGPRMTGTARRLLGLLSVLPDGIAHADLDVLVPEDPEAASTLRKAGLAFDEADRLHVLRPIRDHVETTHPIPAEDLDLLVRHWSGLAVRWAARIDRAGGAEAVTRLTAEYGNVDAMLERGLAAEDPVPALDAAIALAKYLAATGLGSARILHTAREAANRAGDLRREAKLLVALGDLAYSRTDQADVTELYRQAEELYRRIGDRGGEGDCGRRLGDAALVHDDYATADAHYRRARALYTEAGDLHGQADCVKSLGDLALSRDEYAEAIAHYEEARPVYERIGELLGQANCTRRLGNVARKLGEHAQAGRRFAQALALFEEIGDVLGQANCTKGLGDVALAGGDPAAAADGYQRANTLYQQLGNTLGEANSVKFLGDAALAGGDRAAAVECYQRALPLYERIPQPYSAGTTYQRLARLSDGADRTRYVRAAREVWLKIGRADMARKLDEEFGEPVVS
ncbi:tetratricopeptide repeat protein [Amycolatopsis solani]|uniref:tetratricopeptide repeat protein n=1 Tax=Amycolatopsis solani TaxID=3028615 RepID=UPI0025B069CB|nr:tetratricopeptide repeat protein [Amycolatopsis sp. MEP2-6]